MEELGNCFMYSYALIASSFHNILGIKGVNGWESTLYNDKRTTWLPHSSCIQKAGVPRLTEARGNM